MNKRASILVLFAFISFSIFCQTGSCLKNLNHPGYRAIIQGSATDTIMREYLLYVPANYNPDNATPLIVNMHGFGDCASDFYENVGNLYNFNELANQENFLVAYPQGAYRPEKEDTYWEPGDNGSTDIYKNDVYFIEQLVSDIKDEFNIDMSKVYASGYSNGGMMAYSLACNSSELFSAIGIMSGTMLDEDCNLANSIPIIKFHGIEDDVLPYDGSMWYQSVSDVVNFWLNLNDIPSSSRLSTQLNDGKVVRDEYFGGNENSCVTVYTINEEFDKPGYHVWFSDEINGASPNKIMWDFFNGNCSPFSSTEQFDQPEMTIKIQPNPFSNQIILESEEGIGKNFSIHNLQGKSLLSGKLNSSTSTIELGNLPSNIYILNINGTIRKLVKIE